MRAEIIKDKVSGSEFKNYSINYNKEKNILTLRKNDNVIEIKSNKIKNNINDFIEKEDIKVLIELSSYINKLEHEIICKKCVRC